MIAVTYFAVMMPIGAEMILHYPDERHYAYGGARMTETGNWLIPETPQGEVRLKKPILPYWFSAAGFEVLGIGVPGFRLFWVLAACGILLLTYATARALGASRQIAILAELMIAANPVFMRAATNSIPDVPLTLFVTAGALGFVKILAARDRPAAAAWAWLGWIGMALAVLSKGLLPVVLVATLIAYAALWDRARLAALLRPLPLLASIALVSGWYVYAATNYPVEFATQFFGDQITGNATRGPMWVLAYFPAYLLAGVFSFLGWPLMVLWLAAKTRPRLSPAPWPSPVRLLSLWCAVVVAVFAFSDAVDPRYLLPALPAFAVLLALALSALDGEELPESSRISRWLLPVAAVVGLVLAVPEALILAQLGEMPAVILMAAGAAAWVVIAAWGRQAPRLAPYFLAATPVLAMALLALAMAPVVLPDRGEQFAHRLAASGVSASRAAFVDDIHTASETRLHAGAAVPFTEEARLDDAIAAGNCVIMTTRAGLARRLAERGYTVTEIRAGWREIDVPSLLRAIVTLRLAEARDAHGSMGYFAECVETTAAAE
ncbi:MAG TPA: phospholipid carrier-dependent glycosyltransferase [Bauldia sp.]|nr:phospholipid carrier-dependent glycosyltransferase [Bauldia sp.]